MPGRIIIAGKLKAGAKVEKGYVVADAESGLITKVVWEELPLLERGVGDVQLEDQVYYYDEDCCIEAGDVNAHSHPEQSLYTDLVDRTWDLPTWCRNTIYQYSPRLEPEHIYLACTRAFSRMLMHGVTSVLVSFYCHNRQGNRYDREVLRAADATGIRLYFGRMNYDIINEDAYAAKRESQHGYFETPEMAGEFCRELIAEDDHPRIVVAPSVHSIHASTKSAIVSALNLGYASERYVQFHLSEDRGDVQLSLDWYGMRPVEFLVSLVTTGEVPSLEHLLLSDCVWVDEHELDLLKEYGMQVVLNPRMNQRIKAGEANLLALLARGIAPYLGTDGEASNDDLSVTGERRFLQERWQEIPREVITGLGRRPLRFRSGLIGEMAPGCYCDLKVLRGETVVDLFVGAVRVVADGQLQTLDPERDVEEPLRQTVQQLQAGSKS